MSEPTDDAAIDLLAEEVVTALRRGETPNERALAQRYPQLAGSVAEFVRSLTLLEASSSKHHGPTLPVHCGDPFSRTLGDYRLVRELGRGGMGIVYEAEQVSLNRRVAIKILPHSPLFSERAAARFVREATAAARLHHSHIVPVFGLGEQDGLRYFVMQCIHGPGLDVVIPQIARQLEGPVSDMMAAGRASSDPQQAAVLAAIRLLSPPGHAEPFTSASVPPPLRAEATNSETDSSTIVRGIGATKIQPLPRSAGHYWKNVARLGLQAAEALAYAHDHDVLHRDLKPANLLLDAHSQLWLTDFGLAKCLEDEDVLTQSGDLVGTVRYSPPELFRGVYDRRSDLYQLGLTLYEMITFRPAVLAGSRQQAIEAVLHQRPEAPRRIRPDIPRDLETIVVKCLAYEPGNRYASAELLADDLRRFLQDRPIHARRVHVVERTWRWCRRNRAVAALAGLSAAMLLLIGIVSTVAFLREARLRREADRTTQTALTALDRVYDAFVPSWSTIGEAAESGPLTASPEVAQLLEELVQFYDQLAEQSDRQGDAPSPPEAVRALRRVGQIYVRIGNFDKAKETYGRAVQRLGGAQANRDPELALERARVFNDLGIVYWANRQIEESYESHQIAQNLLDRRSTDGSLPADDEWQFELARTCYLLGRQARGRFGGIPLRPVITRAAENFDLNHRMPLREAVLGQAIDLLKPLAARTGNPEHRHLLAVCYRERCDPMLLPDGQPVDATILQAIQILEQLVDEFPDHLGYRYSLCLACHWYTIPFEYKGDILPVALERSNRGLAIAEELAQEVPQEWIFRAIQVDIHLQITIFLKRYGQPEAALHACRKAAGLGQSLWKQYHFPAFGYWLGFVRMFEGDILAQLARPQDAVRSFQRSAELLETSLANNPQWGHVIYRDLKDVYDGLARTLADLEHQEDATRAREQSESYRHLYEDALASRQ